MTEAPEVLGLRSAIIRYFALKSLVFLWLGV
jgi:hypothetical protein